AQRVGHRLLAAGEVDDRQPRVREAGAGVAIQAELVGAAVGERARHALQRFTARRRRGAERDDAGYAAHSSGGVCRYLVERRFASMSLNTRATCSGVSSTSGATSSAAMPWFSAYRHRSMRSYGSAK